MTSQQFPRRIQVLLQRLPPDDLKNNFLQAIPFWLASILTGLVAVGYARLFAYGEQLFAWMTSGHKAVIFLVSPLCFLLAWYVVRLAPTARGSGIPQVMAAIDAKGPAADTHIHQLVNLKVAIVKVISSLLMVLGGGAIGREGPTIQVSASIFWWVNKMIPRSWPRISAKSFLVTGAAAGLAAAFNTPLGGIVFAIEELAKIHISYLRTALFTAVIIAGLTAQALLGPYLYLGYPDVQHLPTMIYAGVIATAIMAELSGALMGKAIWALTQWRRALGHRASVLLIVGTGLLTALVATYVTQQMTGSGKELMNGLLFTAGKQATLTTVLARFAGPVLSFNVGAAGGIFAPSLAAGAAIGGYLVQLFDVAVASNANMFILSGMVAFLTGVTRTPFTAAILVLEMTDRHSVIFHLMLAGLVANLAARAVGTDSLYEQLKRGYE